MVETPEVWPTALRGTQTDFCVLERTGRVDLGQRLVVRPVVQCVGVWDTAFTGEVDAVEVRSAGYRERCACVRCKATRVLLSTDGTRLTRAD
jgi:hypothetical protein